MPTDTQPHTETASPNITTADILAAMDDVWERLAGALERLGPVLSAGPDAGGWTPRQTLSHIIGSWQRVPILAGFSLAGEADVPLTPHDPFWLSEWETAPLEAFRLALRAAYDGTRAFLLTLDPSLLSHLAHAPAPLGDMPLGSLLMVTCAWHIGNVHVPQLEAFLSDR